MRPLLTLPLVATLLIAQPAPQLVVSVGHAGIPDKAAFAGPYLATTSWSNVSLIDLASGLTVSHQPQRGLVTGIEASPPGDLLAIGVCDHSIQVVDVKTRTVQSRITIPQDECPEFFSFSPDGALLASGADGCCSHPGLQVWDVRTGTLTRVLAADATIENVAFSGDGRWLAGVDELGKARVFEWPSGQMLQTFEGLEHPGWSDSALVSSRDGKYLAWIGGGGIRVWDVTTGREIALPDARAVNVWDKPPDGPERRWVQMEVMASAAEFLEDGRLAYVSGDELIVTGLPDGPRQVLPLPEPESTSFGDVAISTSRSWLRIRRDGRMLASARQSRTTVWDVAAAQFRELSSPALTSPKSLRWSRTGIIAWADLESGLRAWDDRAGSPAAVDGLDGSATALAFRADGARVAVAGFPSITVVELAQRRAMAAMDLPLGAETGVAFSDDGSRIAFAASDVLAIYDSGLRRQRVVAKLDAHTDAEHLAFSPDGRWLAAGLGGPEPTLQVWPVEGGTGATLERARVTYGPQPPAFSSDSRRFASFTRGKSVKIWSTQSWTVERTWTLPGSGNALAFAPEGPRLAVAAHGETAVWDAGTGRKLVTLSTPGSTQATDIAWSPDGRRLVSSADDGVLRFWNAADGRLLGSLFTLASSADWLLVAADGRLDGSEQALNTLVAWRTGDRVSRDNSVTRRHRVRDLWRSLEPNSRQP